MNVQIAEGLVIGPDDRLIVNVTAENWDAEMVEGLVSSLQEVIGDRFLVLFGGMEIAKVEGDAS